TKNSTMKMMNVHSAKSVLNSSGLGWLSSAAGVASAAPAVWASVVAFWSPWALALAAIRNNATLLKIAAIRHRLIPDRHGRLQASTLKHIADILKSLGRPIRINARRPQAAYLKNSLSKQTRSAKNVAPSMSAAETIIAP